MRIGDLHDTKCFQPLDSTRCEAMQQDQERGRLFGRSPETMSRYPDASSVASTLGRGAPRGARGSRRAGFAFGGWRGPIHADAIGRDIGNSSREPSTLCVLVALCVKAVPCTSKPGRRVGGPFTNGPYYTRGVPRSPRELGASSSLGMTLRAAAPRRLTASASGHHEGCF